MFFIETLCVGLFKYNILLSFEMHLKLHERWIFLVISDMVGGHVAMQYVLCELASPSVLPLPWMR